MRAYTFERCLCAVACAVFVAAAASPAANAGEASSTQPVATQEASPAPAATPTPRAPAATQAPAVEVAAPKEGAPDEGIAKEGEQKGAAGEEANLRFNFRDVPLDTVLDYLSKTAGFVIVREAKIEGKVDVLSHQPLTKDDAVSLLNAVLNNRGYTAIREGRTLTIVKTEDAKFKDIPVRLGENPDKIPKSGEVITQIIPVRHADATQLLENLTPLLPPSAIANANKSSNAIVLTDTQTDVKRMANIIKALDTSISEISEVRVFALTYSKAADTAKLLTTLFQPPTGQGQSSGSGGFNPIAALFGRGRRGGGDQGQGAQDSAAKQAATRVVAVADERTNAVVVAAPGELMPLIESIIQEVDKSTVPTTDVQVFVLTHSDATEMAAIINDAFGQTTSTASANQQQPQRIFGGGRFGRFGGQPQAPPPATETSSGSYAHATADVRTNSVIVTAEPLVMEQVSRIVEKLESNPAKEHKVFVYKLKNADVQQVAAILQGMVNQQTTANQPRQQSTRSTSSSSTRLGSTNSLGGRSSLLGQ